MIILLCVIFVVSDELVVDAGRIVDYVINLKDLPFMVGTDQVRYIPDVMARDRGH